LIAIFLSAGFLSLCGCPILGWMGYVLAPNPPKIDVPAEYEITEKNKVVVLVYAGASTLYEYPYIQLDLSEYIAGELEKQTGAEVVPRRRVAYFQESNLGWEALPHAQIGDKFNADLVLYVEVLDFNTRDMETGELLKGQLEVNAMLTGVKGKDRGERLWNGEISIVFPEEAPLSGMQSEDAVKYPTFELFADKLVKKFYDHEEEQE
jgi:hypothetical protein